MSIASSVSSAAGENLVTADVAARARYFLLADSRTNLLQIRLQCFYTSHDLSEYKLSSLILLSWRSS